MADYYQLISNAVADLDNKTSESRRAFYDRARATLADQLRKVDPPLSEMFIEHERMALEDAISKVEADAISAQPDAKTQGDRRFVFLGFLILSAVWIGDLFYKPLTFSDRYDWLRVGGIIFFPALTILSYFIMRRNVSVEQEDRAYVVWAPIVLVGAVLVSFALYFISGWIATTPSWAGRYYNFLVAHFPKK
jgi:hypothetical protein